MATSEAADFTKALETEFDKVSTAVSTVDGRRAEAWSQNDQEMIHQAVEANGGFTDLNSTITSRLRDWLCDQGVSAAAVTCRRGEAGWRAADESASGRLGDGGRAPWLIGGGRSLAAQPNPRLPDMAGREALYQLPEETRYLHELCANLARLLHDQNKLEDAEVLARATLSARRAKFKEEEKEEEKTLLFSAMNNLARICKDKAMLEEAEKLFREAIAGWAEVGGEEHEDTLLAKNNLAELLCEAGKVDEAVPQLRAVLEAQRANKDLGEKHAHTLTTMNNLATALRDTEQLEEAEQLFREARRRALFIWAAGTLH